MQTKRINGQHLEKMIRNGLENLRRSEKEINDLNVFPVPDGDTGTNMRLTVEGGVSYAPSRAELNLYLKDLSRGMLLGARGNSGVILSQFFRGVYQELARCATAGPGELRNGLIRGYKAAYAAVARPVEGTILTVAREGIEHSRSQIGRGTTVETLLSIYIAEMRRTLAATPEMLPVLKEAGVVDSGAMGFILIVEGMLKFLYGEVLGETGPAAAPAADLGGETFPDGFDENTVFADGYELEFTLQLMRGEKYMQHFRLESYLEELRSCGTAVAAAQDGRRVKVCIQTMKPARVLALSQEYGEFLSCKVENLFFRRDEQEKRRRPEHKRLATVAVANGQGLRDLFGQFGCDLVLEGGATMNTSAREFLDAFGQLNADTIVVLPNHGNILLAAEQAAALSEGADIRVLPSRSVAEGYFALAMDVADSPDNDYRVAQMRAGLRNVVTLSVTTATRDYENGAVQCVVGDQIALKNGEPVCTGRDRRETILRAVDAVEDMEDREVCVLFCGAGVPAEEGEALAAELRHRFPLLETTVLAGGQAVYQFVLGIS